MSRQVFLSYKSTEYGIADEIRSHLISKGISVWMAPDDIRGGQNYANQIPKAIKGCEVFVIVLSEASMSSIWCSRELDRALNESKRVMPFMIQDIELTDEYSFYLTNVQHYSAYKGFNKELDRMTTDILRYVAQRTDEANRRAIAEQSADFGKEYADEPEKPAEEKPVKPAEKTEKKAEGKSGTEKTGAEKTRPEKREKERKKQELKPKESKKTGEKGNKNRKKLLIPLLAGLGLLAAAILLGVLTKEKPITVCGQEMSVEKTKSLYLDGETLTADDIAAIGKLNKMFIVSLKNCTLPDTDLSPLIQPEVTRVTLTNCGLTDKQFASLPLEGSKVATLELADDPLTDPAPLQKIKDQITFLDISHTELPFSACDGMARLETLIANGLAARDLSPIAGFTGMKQLSLQNCGISDLSPISGLTQLTYLDLGGNPITDLTPLTALLRVQKLYLDCTEISGSALNGLENMTVLSVVDVSNTGVSDISALEKSSSTLTKLYLQNTKVESLYRLRDCHELTVLNIDGTPVENINILSGCEKLKQLSAKGTRLDMCAMNAPLAKQTLSYLDLRGSGIISISNDSDCIMASDCTHLLLSGTSIKEFEFGTGYYTVVDIAGLELSESSAESLLGCNVRYLIADYSLFENKLTELRQSKVGWDNIRFIDCPLDKQLAAEQVLGSTRVSFITAEQAEGLIPLPPQSVIGD